MISTFTTKNKVADYQNRLASQPQRKLRPNEYVIDRGFSPYASTQVPLIGQGIVIATRKDSIEDSHSQAVNSLAYLTETFVQDEQAVATYLSALKNAGLSQAYLLQRIPSKLLTNIFYSLTATAGAHFRIEELPNGRCALRPDLTMDETGLVTVDFHRERETAEGTTLNNDKTKRYIPLGNYARHILQTLK